MHVLWQSRIAACRQEPQPEAGPADSAQPRLAHPHSRRSRRVSARARTATQAGVKFYILHVGLYVIRVGLGAGDRETRKHCRKQHPRDKGCELSSLQKNFAGALVGRCGVKPSMGIHTRSAGRRGPYWLAKHGRSVCCSAESTEHRAKAPGRARSPEAVSAAPLGHVGSNDR